MSDSATITIDSPRRSFVERIPLSRTLGRKLFFVALTIQGLGAFALITLGVLIKKMGVARSVIHPLIRREIARTGVRSLPMFAFLSAGLGLVIVGQTVSWLGRVGVMNYMGTVVVVTIVRELGPILTAAIVLARVGTANVIELGTTRATGEVEALESLGIDPVHYLVVPRVIALALSTFCLTIYLIIGALVSGYICAFLQDIPLKPSDYIDQIASALHSIDFVLLALKTSAFGFVIAIVTCYHGLAQPLRLEEVSRATVHAVAQCIGAFVLLDALCLLVYLFI